MDLVEERLTGPKYQRMSTLDRCVLEENTQLLVRRWKYIRSGSLNDPREVARFFPGQRHLLDILSVVNEEKLIEIADASIPLFGLKLPPANIPNRFTKTNPTALERDTTSENFIALLVRLDGIRTSSAQAAVLYDLSPQQVNLIQHCTPSQLQSLADDPQVGLYPLASDQYFELAGLTEMTTQERTVLAATTRRNRTAYS